MSVWDVLGKAASSDAGKKIGNAVLDVGIEKIQQSNNRDFEQAQKNLQDLLNRVDNSQERKAESILQRTSTQDSTKYLVIGGVLLMVVLVVVLVLKKK